MEYFKLFSVREEAKIPVVFAVEIDVINKTFLTPPVFDEGADTSPYDSLREYWLNLPNTEENQAKSKEIGEFFAYSGPTEKITVGSFTIQCEDVNVKWLQ